MCQNVFFRQIFFVLSVLLAFTESAKVHSLPTAWELVNGLVPDLAAVPRTDDDS